jgi:hypothetical protein
MVGLYCLHRLKGSMGKYRVKNLYELELQGRYSLGLQDSIMCVFNVGPDKAAEMAKDRELEAVHTRGLAEGARAILISMTKLASEGSASAAKLVMSAQQRAGVLQDEQVMKDRWAVEGNISVAPSVSAGFGEQRKLIERMFKEREETNDDC